MPTIYYSVQITQRARQESDNIVAYLAQEYPSAVRTYILAFKEQIKRLHWLPARFPKIRERFRNRRIYRHVLFLRYRLIYRIQRRDVIVLRILHQSQHLNEVE
jgi:plasmid stabilization system protein ParE